MKEQITKRIDELVNENYLLEIQIEENDSLLITNQDILIATELYEVYINRNNQEISFLESLMKNSRTKVNDSELLPSHYTKANEPTFPEFNGKIDCYVYDLQATIQNYKSLVHQLRLREQILLQKLNVELV
jgi:hypothetical protein